MKKDQNIMCSILMIMILTRIGVVSMQISTEMPQIKNDTLKIRSQVVVNVTVGQDFAIGIPQIDIQRVPSDLKVYEITQQKFINVFETLQKHTTAPNETRKQVDNNIFDCTIKSPSMQIIKTLNLFTQKPTNKFSFTSQQSMIYVPIRSKQLLYTLDTFSMQLSVYHFTPQKMNFLSSAKVGSDRLQQKIAMASSSNQQFLYLFSNEGMWLIYTRTVLTNIQKLVHGLNGFKSYDHPIDKLYHGAYNFIFALKRYTAVYLISQDENPYSDYISITKYNGEAIIPQDIYIDSRLLYILDLHRGVFIFKILGNGQITQYDHIAWQSYGNLQIIVKQYSMFIRYLDQQSQKIVQINYNSDKHQASLVRYYKNDQIITSMSIQTVPVSTYQHTYTMLQPFIFLTSDNGQVQVYPYNVDPRFINTPHNGVKMHVQSITLLIYLYDDLYIIATAEQLLYVKIRIEKPQLQCKMRESTGHIYYQIQFSSNVSTCENFENAFEHKSVYNYNCKLITNHMIYVDDPQLSRFQKGLLYGVVFLVVASFIIGLLCLIQWRNNKLSLIGRIKDEIIRFRDRHRRMQPFTEEQPEHQNKDQVQFQLPQALPIPER